MFAFPSLFSAETGSERRVEVIPIVRRALDRVVRKGIPGLLFGLDTIALQVALYLTFWVRFKSGWFPHLPSTQAAIATGLGNVLITSALFLTPFWWLVLTMRGLYRQKVIVSRWDEVIEVFKGTATGIILIFIAFFEVQDPFPPTQITLFVYGGSIFLLVGGVHFLLRSFQKYARSKGIGLWRVLVIGWNRVGFKLATQLESHYPWGFKVAGFIAMERDDPSTPAPLPYSDWNIAGHLGELPRFAQSEEIEWALVAPDEAESHEGLMRVLDRCWASNLKVMLVADSYQMVVGLKGTVHIHGLPLIEVLPRLISPTVVMVKRIVDIIVSAIMSAVVLLLTPVIGLAIKLDTPGPIFYLQRRVGKGGKEFTLIKFRSMVKDAEEESGAVWAQPHDPRITRVGRILRRFHLDEFPQFFNVLLGQMSLVGPRPERRELIDQMRDLIPLYERRLSVRPGMTGWAQIRYKYDETIEDVKEKTAYDLYYIDNLSLSLDLKIIFITFWQILKGKGR